MTSIDSPVHGFDPAELVTRGLDTAGTDFDDIGSIRFLWAAEAHLAWRRLRLLGEILTRRHAGGTTAEDDRLLLDTETMLAAELGTVTATSKDASRAQVELAIDTRDRLRQIATVLRDGLISFATFRGISLECAAITDPETMAAVDAEIALELRECGAVSSRTGRDIARRFVAEYDPDAVRERRQARGKGITVSHDCDESALSIIAEAEDVLLAKKAIDAAAATQTCADDPRSLGARRAALAIARLTGGTVSCQCGNTACSAKASSTEVADRFATVVVHVIAQSSTLVGESTTAGWMDGFGVIDAHRVREIVNRPDSIVHPLDLDSVARDPAQSGNRYRPTMATDTAVRTIHGTCAVPGCARAAWDCDLDHVTEYNHHRPADGGATCPCNLAPKCRLHHLIKTHADDWLDDHIVDANGVFWTETTTPSGHTVRARAHNYWLLPELGLLPCQHGAPIAPGNTPDEPPTRSRSRTEAKHAYRIRLRSRRRYLTECAAAAKLVEQDSLGPPPF